MNFWDTYDARALDVHPGYSTLTWQRAAPPTARAQDVLSVAQCSHEPCSQNDTAGVCDWCGVASDDVMIGVCADCS